MAIVKNKKIQPKKAKQLAELKKRLEKNPNFILASYSGLTVKGMENLRAELRKSGSELKVIKNNLFLKALKESEKHASTKIEFGPDYKGPLAAIFSDDNLPSIAKVCKDFAKTNEKFVPKLGFFSGEVLDKNGVDGIAGLPTREELLAQIARGINAPATQIASGINQIIASLARAIQAVAEKSGK